MSFLISFLFICLSYPPEASNDQLYGEWISLNNNYQLIISIDKENIRINTYPTKENSIYPQSYNYSIEKDRIILFANNEVVDTLHIKYLSKSELILYFNIHGYELNFIKNEKIYDPQELLDFLNTSYFSLETWQGHDHIIDTIYYDKNVRLKIHDNQICEYEFFDSVQIIDRGKLSNLSFQIARRNVDFFVLHFDKKVLKGFYYYESMRREITFRKLPDFKSSPLLFGEDIFLGNWVSIENKSDFEEKIKKKNKSIYIGYMSITFSKNGKAEAFYKNESDQCEWKREKILNHDYMLITNKKINPDHGGYVKIIEANEKYIILEDTNSCNSGGHLADIPEDNYIYLIKK